MSTTYSVCLNIILENPKCHLSYSYYLYQKGQYILKYFLNFCIVNSCSSSLKDGFSLADMQRTIQNVRRHLETEHLNGYHNDGAAGLCHFMMSPEHQEGPQQVENTFTVYPFNFAAIKICIFLIVFVYIIMLSKYEDVKVKTCHLHLS